MSPGKDRQLNIFIPESWHEWLRGESFRTRLSIAEIVRRALEATHGDLPRRDTPDEGQKGGFYRPDPRVIAASRCVDGPG